MTKSEWQMPKDARSANPKLETATHLLILRLSLTGGFLFSLKQVIRHSGPRPADFRTPHNKKPPRMRAYAAG